MSELGIIRTLWCNHKGANHWDLITMMDTEFISLACTLVRPGHLLGGFDRRSRGGFTCLDVLEMLEWQTTYLYEAMI